VSDVYLQHCSDGNSPLFSIRLGISFSRVARPLVSTLPLVSMVCRKTPRLFFDACSQLKGCRIIDARDASPRPCIIFPVV